MRYALFVFVLLLAACNTKSPIMTELEFSSVFLDSLRKKYPDVKFELQEDLGITAKKDSLDLKHYAHNSYALYKAQPDSLAVIVSRYLASTEDAYLPIMPIDKTHIVPVIKPLEFVSGTKDATKPEQDIDLATEPYSEDLLVAYAEDTRTSTRYLTKDDIKALGIPQDSLRSMAVNNLRDLLPEVKIHGSDGKYMVTAGGAYEACLVLTQKMWTKDNFKVDGDIVVAIPNRDVLLVTGSKNTQMLKELKKRAVDGYKNNSYPVSEHLYKWTGSGFVMFD